MVGMLDAAGVPLVEEHADGKGRSLTLPERVRRLAGRLRGYQLASQFDMNAPEEPTDVKPSEEAP